MGRRYLGQLGEREAVNEVFVVSDKQLRPNRNGNLYLQMRLTDRTGSVNAMMWNASDRSADDFDVGDYVRIEGTTQYYNGNMQIIVTQVELAEPGDVNEEELIQIDREQTERHMARLAAILRDIKNVSILNLVEAFLLDEALIARFKRAPAGVKTHHAYPGGLLEHVVSVMELAILVAPRYDAVDQDLLVMGAFLHDIGKLEELTYDRHLGYSDEGQLIGHLVQGVGILERKIDEATKLSGEPFPGEIAMRLKHMIVSHHGEVEFGSPKVPMTFEAIALRYLDDLDAKINNFQQIIRDDVNVDSQWTTYQPNLGRKLYKGNKQ
jgi:3'-5' exoribonuclease